MQKSNYSQVEHNLTEEEIVDLDAVEPDAKAITYTGQDFDVDGLVKRLRQEDILIPTFGHADERIESAGFQRAFVWRKPQMDKFIESILLGYPIPGIFLVKQDDNRYLVLDGQQRLLTLKLFAEGIYAGREFTLKSVADEFRDLTYRSLPDALRRKFDNTFIQAIIVATDGSTESLESIYRIFERLNSGGTQLTPHEIRVALYAGPFIDFIEHLNMDEGWRQLYGSKSPRLRDQELVLRIFGLVEKHDEYKRPMKKFLSDVVANHRDDQGEKQSNFENAFRRATSILNSTVGSEAFRVGQGQVNAALTEAIMVGLILRLQSNSVPPLTHRIAGAVDVIKNEAKDAYSRSTADESQVSSRISLASKAFDVT